MSDTCNNCEYKERCAMIGFEQECEDQDECEHFYSFSEEENDV